MIDSPIRSITRPRARGLITMESIPFHPFFGITHPLGLPRPVDPENLFGAKAEFLVANLMPIPTGCLAHFDGAVYRPYLKRVVALLGSYEFGWSGPAILDDPPRYCVLHDGIPAEVPPHVRPLLPEPPRVSLEVVLGYFDRSRAQLQPMQLLDVLTLVSEDLGPDRFAAATAGRPWVAEYMR